MAIAEDETALIAKAEFDCVTHSLVGYCGTRCARRCTTAPECLAAGCADVHGCVANHEIPLATGDGAYAALTKQHDAAQTGTRGRVFMICPHDENLPRFPCLWTATCDRFECNDYVLEQWDLLHTLLDRHLKAVIGRCIDHASDGDPWRRKAMLLYSLPACVLVARQYTLTACEGFVFTGYARYGDDPELFNCQDWIHNGKKMVQCLVHASRSLALGHHTAHIGLLATIRTRFAHHEHGTHATDLDRLGYNAMDWTLQSGCPVCECSIA